MVTKQWTVSAKSEKKQLENIYKQFGFYNCKLELRFQVCDVVTLVFKIKINEWN